VTLTYGSLFTGVGGFDLGFDQAGYDCRWQVEWDKHCQQTLAYHWPNVPRHHDVCDVNGATLQPVDVITYGSPCQDLSVAGTRKGLGGNKSSMFFEAIRVIEEMRNETRGTSPRITVWENVPGALRSNKGKDFGVVLNTLADSGAVGLEWRVLDAQFFGVPARRRRLFLVAIYDPRIRRAQPGDLLPIQSVHRRRVRPHTDPTIGFYRTHGRHDQPQQGLAPTLKAITPICIAGPGNPPRRLTPTEHERLMGWPDQHTAHRADGKTNSDTTRYKMCGNGVATPVAQWIATNLRKVLEQ